MVQLSTLILRTKGRFFYDDYLLLTELYQLKIVFDIGWMRAGDGPAVSGFKLPH